MNLDEVKTFILTSFAMTTLRESFRQFVFQGQSKTQKQNKAISYQGPPPPELGKDSIIPLEEPDTDSVDSFEDDERDFGVRNRDMNSRLLPRLVLSLLRGAKTVAEFLELKEKPLKQGFRRLRWTCVSFTFLFASSIGKSRCIKYQPIL